MNGTQEPSGTAYDIKSIVIALLVFIVIVEAVFLFLNVREEKAAGKTTDRDIVAATATVQRIPGIEENSTLYQGYASCVSACGQCPASCEQDTLRGAAMEKQDASYCGRLQEADRQPCTDRVTQQQALDTKDKTVCDRLSGEELKLECRTSVSIIMAREADDVSSCSDLPEERRARCEQAYYLDAAVVRHDASLCDKITDPSEQAACKENVRRATEGAGEGTG